VIALGVDAATKTGWALVHRAEGRERLIAHGVLNFKKFPNRWQVADTLATWAKQGNASVVVIELPWLGKDPHAAEVLARICGRFEQAFEPGGAKVRVIRSSQWQTKMIGPSRLGRDALKKLAVAWCRSNFGEELPDDAADAAVMAVFALRFPG